MQVGVKAKGQSRKRIEGFLASFGHPLQRLFFVALILVFVISACATPIGVRYVEPQVAHHSLTANVLSAERPSSFTSRELINLNLYQRFEARCPSQERG
jgi:hypothetical protein